MSVEDMWVDTEKYNMSSVFTATSLVNTNLNRYVCWFQGLGLAHLP